MSISDLMGFLGNLPVPALPGGNGLMGFGPTRYDPGYPAGYFTGFSIAVDATRDPTLGGGWQSMSLGSMEMNTNDLPAGGYMRTTFREIERISYGRVSLSRAYVPGTSTSITEWFSWARTNGPTSVAITVEIPAHVQLKVTYCEPAIKGDTVSGGGKPCTVSTGLNVIVPYHIKLNDILKIDTRSGEYVEKINK